MTPNGTFQRQINEDCCRCEAIQLNLVLALSESIEIKEISYKIFLRDQLGEANLTN